MNSTKDDFETRKNEVENYLSFLSILNDEEKTLLKYKKKYELKHYD